MNWDQLKAILLMRWQLTLNQAARGNKLNVIAAIVMAVVVISAAVGCGIGGIFLGAIAGAKAPPLALLFIWDGILCVFLFMWLTGLLVEIQRSESIDLTKLLHLPVTLRQVFVFNYVASHLTPSIIIAIPGIIGFCAGLVIGGGPLMVLLLPPALSFIFVITSWTYCLRGWLAALMINKRRRRAVIVWITIGFVLVSQLPNLVFNSPLFRSEMRGHRQARNLRAGRGSTLREESAPLQIVVAMHPFLPPGWTGYAAMKLKSGDVLPDVAFTVAGLLIGALGLMQAYRMTLRFYLGAEKTTAKQDHRPARPRRKGNGQLLLERRLPWMPDDTAALALATFRSLLRAPELKMALIMPVVMGVLFGSMWLTGRHHAVPALASAFAASAAVAFAAFTTAPTMSNVFGLDRNGFRALVLLPIRRNHILLAKNVAFFPFNFVVAGAFLLLLFFLLRLPVNTILTGLLQVPTAYLCFSVLCNFLSILCPYKLAAGTLKAKRPKAIMFITMFATMIATPIVLLPIAVPVGAKLLWAVIGLPPWLPIDVFVAVGMLGLVGWVYVLLLPAQGHLLERREMAILREVTEETE